MKYLGLGLGVSSTVKHFSYTDMVICYLHGDILRRFEGGGGICVDHFATFANDFRLAFRGRGVFPFLFFFHVATGGHATEGGEDLERFVVDTARTRRNAIRRMWVWVTRVGSGCGCGCGRGDV